jgi:hypothetical protein
MQTPPVDAKNQKGANVLKNLGHFLNIGAILGVVA